MKIETAITQLKKEQEFLGLGLLELLQDIQKDGRMVYSEKTVQAYQVFMDEGAKMFAPIA
jgi:predicted component of type VI protein secretion system